MAILLLIIWLRRVLPISQCFCWCFLCFLKCESNEVCDICWWWPVFLFFWPAFSWQLLNSWFSSIPWANNIPARPCFDFGHLNPVSNAKIPCSQRFFFPVWNPVGNLFLILQLIPFVCENFCNCASRGKFRRNEFFKLAYKISKLRLQKCILDARKWILHSQFTRCQRTITHPKLPD